MCECFLTHSELSVVVWFGEDGKSKIKCSNSVIYHENNNHCFKHVILHRTITLRCIYLAVASRIFRLAELLEEKPKVITESDLEK